MRWSLILVPFTLLVGCALGGSSDDSPSERFLNLHKKALAHSPVKFDDAAYRKATALPRDYSVAVLLTAQDPRFGCHMCRQFGPEWDMLSSQWTKGDKKGNSKLIFSILDFNDGRDTFQSLGLQTAPVLLLFQPTTGEFAVPETEPLRFDFNAGQPNAEAAREWIVRHLPGRPHPAFSYPINWIAIGGVVFGIVTTVTVVWAFYGYIELVLTSKALWKMVAIGIVLLSISGHWFNSIRGTQYAGHDGRGGVKYIAGGFQTQYQLESQIVAVMYGLLALSALALADKVPRIANPKLQSLAVLAWGGFMLVGYSVLLSIFRVKNGGYPFKLPPFL